MTHAEFMERLRNSPRPVVVDVWAPWCGPCRQMAPVLERISSDYAGRVDLWKLDADDEPDLARSLGVMGIPTLVVFQGEQELTRRVGAQPAAAVDAIFAAAEAGVAPAPTGLLPRDRVLRLAAALVLGVIGWTAGSPLVLVLAGLVFFSGIHDRCPMWQALAPRLASLVRRATPRPDITSEPAAKR